MDIKQIAHVKNIMSHRPDTAASRVLGTVLNELHAALSDSKANAAADKHEAAVAAREKNEADAKAKAEAAKLALRPQVAGPQAGAI